ncbi:MAG: LacI family DNA-binding transcriptional regulator [Candidatus Caldatribacteriota bacterium]|nr:LacI family DNA-binding transcriptional regulator [Candidatus Caldatribacteriota bacterium]
MKEYNIKDIAKIANVSPRTVSRVVNREKKVKKETRDKILKIIKSTGYQVNLIARSLRKKATGILIVFVEKNAANYIGNFHNVFIRYLDSEANRVGYKLVVSKSSASKVEENKHDGFYLLKNSFADGAIIFDTREIDRRIDYLVKRNIPFVIVGRDNVYKSTSFVNLDNVKAGYLGAEHLIKRGNSSVRFFLGDKNFTVNQDRTKGFIQAFKDYHIKSELTHIDYGIMNPKIAYEKMKNVLEEEAPDALFVSGDQRAIGVYHAIQEKGLKIPRDIAVLGIDNIPLSEYYYPALTTISQSVRKMAEGAIEILDQKLKNPKKHKNQRTIFQPKLIVRDST